MDKGSEARYGGSDMRLRHDEPAMSLCAGVFAHAFTTGLGTMAITAACLVAGGGPALAEGKSGTCAPAAFRVVLDVGHTADSPGAFSARGVTEYSFNMQLADAIRQALLDSGFEQTSKLIITGPARRGLFERATRANTAHADLFIAIHHDSVPDYLLENWEYEGKKQQYSDRFSGYSIFVSHANADVSGSLAFGHLLGMELQKQGLHYTPHYTLELMKRYRHDLLDSEAGVYRYDHLVVLHNTRMPAVLLEAGSIANRQEELELATPERRLAIAKAVTAAVTDFCATRAPDAVHEVKAPASDAARGTKVSMAHRARGSMRRHSSVWR
jgi:N-acetylmuramoyl-L-alanine amidase